MEKVKTDYRKEKESRDLEIYEDYQRLMAQPGAMTTAVERILMRKYGIYSNATIWNICQRVKRRLNLTHA